MHIPGDWWKELFRDSAFYTPGDKFALRAAGRETRFAAKVLRLPRGAALLDLCCGPGRHSIPLAKRGFRVTGLDYSTAYLKEARREAFRRGAKVRFVKGDMRAPGFRGEFDAALCLFTSFGYFSRRSENLRVLRGVARALKPGGAFLLDVVNREYVLPRFRPRNWWNLGREGFRLEEVELSSDKRRTLTSWTRIFPNGRSVEKRFAVHLYDKKSISSQLRKAGLKPLRFWGGFDGKRLSPQTNRLIVLSKKFSVRPA